MKSLATINAPNVPNHLNVFIIYYYISYLPLPTHLPTHLPPLFSPAFLLIGQGSGL